MAKFFFILDFEFGIYGRCFAKQGYYFAGQR